MGSPSAWPSSTSAPSAAPAFPPDHFRDLPPSLMSNLFITGGRIIDPANRRDETADLLILDGKIAAPGTKPAANTKVETVDAKGLIVAPGLIDLHVHLREPGQSAKETIATGSKCAAAGG